MFYNVLRFYLFVDYFSKMILLKDEVFRSELVCMLVVFVVYIIYDFVKFIVFVG